MTSFKTMEDLIFLRRTSNFIDDENFFCCLTFSSGRQNPGAKFVIFLINIKGKKYFTTF